MEYNINHKTNNIVNLFFKNDKYHIVIDDLVNAKERVAVEPILTTYAQIIKKTKTITPKVEKPKLSKDFVKQGKIIISPNRDTSQFVDINNYSFEEKNKTSINKREQQGGKDSTVFILPKQRNYDVEYFINELTSQLDFSYMNYSYQPFTGGTVPVFQNSGFDILFKVGLNDLMEDYRIIGGVNLSVNLSNNEYFLSYQQLKGRFDKELIFHRNSIENVQEFYISEHKIHEAFYRISYPFSHVLALKGTSVLQNKQAIYLSVNKEHLEKPNENDFWGGLKLELVFDNTRSRGLNINYGIRYKIFGEYYQMIDRDDQNLAVVGFDFRKYQKIHKSFIWANRISVSTNFGNNKLVYYMGGVDNWLIPKFNRNNTVDYSKNYVYQSLALNMRGFEQNIRHGNSFALFNSELRLPVFRYFSKTPIKSNFLYNFQVVAFGDFGGAFIDTNPFSEENTTFKEYIYQHPITVTIIKQKNPFVSGYGFGLRSKILGYFVRTDWAWGIENGKIMPAVFYLSLNLDF